jgi:hypothetical protein
MSDVNASDKDLADRVRDVLQRLREEKINNMLTDAGNNDLPVAHREMLARRAMWVLNDAQKTVTDGVDYNIPSPNVVRFNAVQPATIPEDALSKDAYNSTDTSTLFLNLETIRQMTDDILEGPPLGSDGNPATLTDAQNAALAQLAGNKSDLRETHYANVSVGLHFHYYLDWLFDQWGALKFLQAKTMVESLLYTYNAHNPAVMIRTEEEQLRAFRVIASVAHDVWTYLGSPAFSQVQQTAQAQTGQPTISVAPTATPPVVSPPLPATTSAISVPPPAGTPPFLISGGVTPSAVSGVPAKVMRAEKKKRGLASIFAVTAADSVTIDLSASRVPTDVVSEIEQLFLSYVSEGLDTVTQMKVTAQTINYNIFTNQFGSSASLTDNVSMMESIRGNILKYIADQFHPSPALQPMLFLIQEFDQMFFPGPIGPGNPVASKNLMPNESVEMRMKTSETDSTKRAQTNSVVDSNSQTAKQSLENTLQNTAKSEHSTTADYSAYDSTANTLTTNAMNKTSGYQSRAAMGMQNIGNAVGQVISGGMAAGGMNQAAQNQAQQISSGVGGILSGIIQLGTSTAKLNANTGIKVDTSNVQTSTGNTTHGSSTNTNDTRNDAVENMSTAVSNNSQETNASRTASVTDSTESTTQTTKEDSEVRTFRNPNRSSCLNVVFCQILRRFTGASLWVSEKVMFANGVVSQTVPLSGLQDILDTIIRPDRQDAKDAVWAFVKSTLKVVDWQGRMIDMSDDSTGSLRVRNEFYFDMLGKANLPEVPSDALIKLFHEDLRGVVMGVNTYTMVVPGIFADAQIGHIILDANETKLFDIEVKRKNLVNDRSEREIKRIDIDNTILDNKRDFVEKLTDEDKKEKAYFELFKDDRAILDRTYLENFLDNFRGRKTRGPQTEPP